jgi:hypothetical protein
VRHAWRHLPSDPSTVDKFDVRPELGLHFKNKSRHIAASQSKHRYLYISSYSTDQDETSKFRRSRLSLHPAPSCPFKIQKYTSIDA